MGLQVEEISHWICLRGAGKPDVAEHKREEQSCPECCPEQDGRPELPLRCLVVEEERANDDSPEPPRRAMMCSVFSLILSQPMTARSLSPPIATMPAIPITISHPSMFDWVRRLRSDTLR